MPTSGWLTHLEILMDALLAAGDQPLLQSVDLLLHLTCYTPTRTKQVQVRWGGSLGS